MRNRCLTSAALRNIQRLWQMRQDVAVNGKPMQFIADTGAEELYLSRHQAYQLGFDPLKADDIETDDFGDRSLHCQLPDRKLIRIYAALTGRAKSASAQDADGTRHSPARPGRQ
jgi:gag-polyprotein putative aspartyl protease